MNLIFEIYFTCSGARYPMTKHHAPRRYNRIVVFNHCAVHSPYNDWNPSCWNTTAASQQDADREAASVQQSSENYLSLCRQRNRYQTGDHILHHPYIIDIHVCKILGRSLVQSVNCTAEDLSHYQKIRICGWQSGTRTGFLWVHTISSVDILAPAVHIRTSSVIERK
jgi:hypothetical protein